MNDMSPTEKGEEFENRAKIILEQEGFLVKDWISQRNRFAPCDMLIQKDGKDMYCEIRGVTDEKTPITIPSDKMARLEELNKHIPLVIFALRGKTHKMIPFEDLGKEKNVYLYKRSYNREFLNRAHNDTGYRLCKIQVMVSDEAKRVLTKYKEEGKYKSQDDALEALLLEFKKRLKNE